MKRCCNLHPAHARSREHVRRRRGCAGPEDLAGFALDHLGLHHLRGRAEAMRVYAIVANPSCSGQEV